MARRRWRALRVRARAEGGGIAIEGLPANAALPSVLPAGSYEMRVEGRNPFFVSIFYLAMSLIIMGVGFLKPNISTIVGQLYAQGDPRRDAGFTLYYFGINLGAFWSSALCAGLGVTVGWWAGFGLAGIGMFLGWCVFVRRRLLFFLPGPAELPEHLGAPPDAELIRKPFFGPLSREHRHLSRRPRRRGRRLVARATRAGRQRGAHRRVVGHRRVFHRIHDQALHGWSSRSGSFSP